MKHTLKSAVLLTYISSVVTCVVVTLKLLSKLSSAAEGNINTDSGNKRLPPKLKDERKEKYGVTW